VEDFRKAPGFAPVRHVLYHFTRFLVRTAVSPFVKIHVLRPEAAVRHGPYILACNHISHFDAPLVALTVRYEIHWMAIAALFRRPFLAAWFRAIGMFPVDRKRMDRHTVQAALARLRAGHAVGMFPEGGIRDGARSVLGGAPLRPGVAGFAQRSGAPVVPCVVLGSDRCYALRKLWRPGRRIPVWIAFGAPLLPPGGPDRVAARAALEADLAAAFRELALEMRRHFHLSDDDFPQPPRRRRGEGAPPA
jgi:1-acyl-sn-glycerol-3-phosphate acyltransferase